MSILEGIVLVAAGFVAGRGLEVFSGPINSWLYHRRK